MIYGGIYGAFFLEKIHDIESKQITSSIFYASKGQFELADEYHKKTMEVATFIDGLRSAHAHLSMFSVIALAIAANSTKFKIKEKWLVIMAIVYLVGALIFPVGVIL